jgi:ABC-type polysaccharide/polyol phosphate export permease
MRYLDGSGRRAAFGTSPRHFAELSLQLARDTIKLHYRGATLSYAWVVGRPLLWFGALYVLFTAVFPFGRTVPHYSIQLLLALMMWTYFSEAIGTALLTIVADRELVRKLSFPRMVLPLASVLAAMFNLVVNLTVVLAFALAAGVEPRWSWLEMVPLCLVLSLLAACVGLFVSQLYSSYRDVLQLWSVAAQLLFYASAVLYPVTQVHTVALRYVMLTNPVVLVLTQARKAVVDPHAPSAFTAVSSPWPALVGVAVLIGLCALGIWSFCRKAPRLAEIV